MPWLTSTDTSRLARARDAIVAAAQASLPGPQASADVADVWEGFRIRGMGFSARVDNNGVGQGTARVTEAFDAPNLLQTPSVTISDTASGDGDGFDWVCVSGRQR